MNLEVVVVDEGVFLKDKEEGFLAQMMILDGQTYQGRVIQAEEICRKVNSVYRKRLPDTRLATTHHFTIATVHDGYVTVGLYDDGQPGEIFIRMSKAGSTIGGLLDCWAIAVSMALQYGVPLKALTDKMSWVRFEPSGFTGQEFKEATSVIDYICRWLAARFLKPEEGRHPSAPDSIDQLSGHQEQK